MRHTSKNGSVEKKNLFHEVWLQEVPSRYPGNQSEAESRGRGYGLQIYRSALEISVVLSLLFKDSWLTPSCPLSLSHNQLPSLSLTTSCPLSHPHPAAALSLTHNQLPSLSPTPSSCPLSHPQPAALSLTHTQQLPSLSPTPSSCPLSHPQPAALSLTHMAAAGG